MNGRFYYELRFMGDEKQVIRKLQQASMLAAEFGFKEHEPLWQVDYITDYDTPDKFTPMVINEQGKQVIDPAYRYAKIQYQAGFPILYDISSFAEYELRVKLYKERLPHLSGFIQHLWLGERCEPLNLGLIHYGKGKNWTGSAFSRIEPAEPVDEFSNNLAATYTLLKELERDGLWMRVEEDTLLWEFWLQADLLSCPEITNPAIRARLKAQYEEDNNIEFCLKDCGFQTMYDEGYQYFTKEDEED